jgi:hypothetical protein
MKEAFNSTRVWIKFALMTSMKVITIVLAAALLSPLVLAQGTGVVDGKLVNGTDPAGIPAKLPLEVIGLGSGMSVLKSAVADASGKFLIEGLPTDAPILIRAIYRGVNYYAQTGFDSSGKAHVEILIYEPAESSQGIRVENARMAVKLGKDGLRTLESYVFVNETKPPRTYLRQDGSFRFSKAPGIVEPPRVDVEGPGSSMPVSMAPLESADGTYYYSQYPLRPGSTAFNVAQSLPYQNQKYTYRKKFYQDVTSLTIGVSPHDLVLTGQGLTKLQSDPAQNVAVYAAGPFKSGEELVWTFSGGTPVAEAPAAAAAPAPESAPEPSVRPMPTMVAQNAWIIGPLLLIGLIVVLWYAQGAVMASSEEHQSHRIQDLKERREQLLDFVAALDARNEAKALDHKEYSRLREHGKRHLRRIAMLLANK